MPALFTNQDAAIAELTTKLAKVTAERDRARDIAVALEQEVADLVRQQSEALLQPPTEPGLVAFEVEILPTDWANDGKGWCRGRGTPAEVAQILHEYANHAESFTTRGGAA